MENDSLPVSRADILRLVNAELISFENRKKDHGTIIIHVGGGDFSLEVNRKYEKIVREKDTTAAAVKVQQPTWK